MRGALRGAFGIRNYLRPRLAQDDLSRFLPQWASKVHRSAWTHQVVPKAQRKTRNVANYPGKLPGSWDRTSSHASLALAVCMCAGGGAVGWTAAQSSLQSQEINLFDDAIGLRQRVEKIWDDAFSSPCDLSRQYYCLGLALLSQRWFVRFMHLVADQTAVSMF